MHAHQVKKLMNKSRSSFLFGFDYEMKNGFFIENPLSQSDILWRVGEVTNSTLRYARRSAKFRSLPISFEQYKTRFDMVQNEIKNGNSFLANLTIATTIQTDYSMDEIFARSNSRYAILMPDEFVCFSPEPFVTIESGKIWTNPMKGTISAAVENAEQVILNDYKERAEHCTIVDFMRSELSRVATKIKVDRFGYIDRLNTSKGDILQVSSQISGELLSEKLGDIIWELLPAGSISGAPKISTVRALVQAEECERGYYTGVFGYWDGQRLESAVMIRYIEQSPTTELRFRSGGGITINSECRAEYDEFISKIYLPFE